MSVRAPALLLGLVAACNPSVEVSPDAPPAVDAPRGQDPRPTREHVRYRGTLSSTPSVQFGGDTFCTYSVQMREVVFDVVVRGDEDLTSMSVDNTMVESIVGSCPYAPQPQNRQHFSLSSSPTGARDDGSFAPVLAGDASNQPRTALASRVTQQGGTLQATARWERVDIDPPLNWAVNTAAPVTLQPATCEAGAFVCAGGSSGSLYVCEDGMHMSMVRPCAAGCASSERECN